MGGGRKRGRSQRRHFKEERENVWKDNPKRPPAAAGGGEGSEGGWQPFATENPAFEDYYKGQQIVPEEEWDAFMSMLRKPLPAAFRINARYFIKYICHIFCVCFFYGLILLFYQAYVFYLLSSSQFYKDIQSQLENDFRKSLETEVSDEHEKEAIRPLPWYPGNLAWHLNFSRMQLRRNQALESFHEFLKQENEVGNITRQEAVSMVPPLFLKVQPDHHILDNESKPQRLEFDCVLCDVPCSGDGTVRKAPDMWRTWNIGMGNGLHRLQVEIAMRGIALLKVGGRMVYSTCSLNPVENEAVVGEILRRCGDSVELLDVSNELPELVRRPGLSTWKVRDRGSWVGTYEDVLHYRKKVISPSMFPSGKGATDSCTVGGSDVVNIDVVDAEMNESGDMVEGKQETKIATNGSNNGDNANTEEIKQHESESGSDMVLSEETSINQQGVDDSHVLNEQKNRDMDNEISEDRSSEEAKVIVAEVQNDQASKRDKRKTQNQTRWRGVDPVIFFKDEATIRSIVSYYGIKDSFKLEGHLVTRNPDTSHVKRIYYVSKSVQEVLELNVKVGERLKITSLGLKIFERQSTKEDSPCTFRLSSEGLPLLLPYITKQILYASAIDFQHLLQYRIIKFPDFVDAKFGEEASALLRGCCVVILREGHQDVESIGMDPNAIAIVCWKGKTNLCVMLTPMDGKELLDRISFRFGLKIPKVDGKPSLKSDGSDEQPDGGDEAVNPECVPESKASDMEISDVKEAE
ncbi:hypothetical protein ACQ4PT_064901 [Festuca glaucescens]